MALVQVKFKNGKTGMVMQREVEGLRKAGVLADSKKEEKTKSTTKEHKETGSTKTGNLSGTARPTKKFRDTTKPREANISSKNVKKGK